MTPAGGGGQTGGGAGGGGGGVMGGITDGAAGGGGRTAMTGAGAPGCWQGELRPQPMPIAPQLGVADACGAVAGATALDWTFPGGTNDQDRKAWVVGRWATCGGATIAGVAPHAGIELDGNGRWRLLEGDAATGALVLMDPGVERSTGYYYLLGTGQLNLTGEGPDGGTRIFFARFAAGTDALQLSGDTGSDTPAIYARAAPPPSTVDPNLPSVFDGRCSLAGTWNLPSYNTTQPPAIISFDQQGNFVAAPDGRDLCSGHTMYGTYRLSPGWFQLTSNVGMGSCAWWYTAAYPAEFDADCTHLTLMMAKYDNCTGARGYFSTSLTLLTRIP